MYEFTPADPTIKRPGHEPRIADKSAILFVYIPLVGFASMMLGIVTGENDVAGFARSANLVLGLVLNVLALMWAKIDANERRYELSRFFTLAVVIFGVFAIIYYLFRSRGARGGLISFGWLILYGLALVVALSLVSAIVTVVLVMIGVLPQSILDA
jgi:hypothetical protein